MGKKHKERHDRKLELLTNCRTCHVIKPNFNEKTKFTTSKTRMQSWTTVKGGQHHKRLPSLMSSMRFYQVQMLWISPKKKEVGFKRKTNKQETISLDGGSSSLTNSTDSRRSSDGKMNNFYENQEILRRGQVKPSVQKKSLLKFQSM